MNIEELQALWKTQRAAPLANEPELLAKLKADSAVFDRRIRNRDAREFLAAAVAAVMFALPIRKAVGPLWAQLAAIAIILAVPFVAIIARRRLRRQHDGVGADTRRELARVIAETRLQVRLLTSVAWWYLLPLWISAALIEYRWHAEYTLKWVRLQLWFVLPFCVFVCWLNRRAVRRTLAPRLEQLLAIQQEWERMSSAAESDDAPPKA